ncbi:hypothetical protein Tco_0171216 [Tanacetum coccineum]
MLQSGGVAQGCRGLTCVGIGAPCDHTSSELIHPAAPSKRQASLNAHPTAPSSVLGGPANHLGSYCGRRPRSPQILRIPLLHRLPYRTFDLPRNLSSSRPKTHTLVEFHDNSHFNQRGFPVNMWRGLTAQYTSHFFGEQTKGLGY